jgi:hypothetical protein
MNVPTGNVAMALRASRHGLWFQGLCAIMNDENRINASVCQLITVHLAALEC